MATETIVSISEQGKHLAAVAVYEHLGTEFVKMPQIFDTMELENVNRNRKGWVATFKTTHSPDILVVVQKDGEMVYTDVYNRVTRFSKHIPPTLFN